VSLGEAAWFDEKSGHITPARRAPGQSKELGHCTKLGHEGEKTKVDNIDEIDMYGALSNNNKNVYNGERIRDSQFGGRNMTVLASKSGRGSEAKSFDEGG